MEEFTPDEENDIYQRFTKGNNELKDQPELQ